MQYVWMAVVGLAIGLLVGRFLLGNNFSVLGDLGFAVAGALAFGLALNYTQVLPDAGSTGKAVIAAMGAFAALLLRRTGKG
jgi:hypothetical protein